MALKLPVEADVSAINCVDMTVLDNKGVGDSAMAASHTLHAHALLIKG